MNDATVDIQRQIHASDHRGAAASLLAAWPELIDCAPAELQDLLLHLPDDILHSMPELLVVLAWTYRVIPPSKPFVALAYLDAAERAADAVSDDRRITVLCLIARAMCLRTLGRAVEADAASRIALSVLDTREPGTRGLSVTDTIDLRSRALFERGICSALLGDLESADVLLRHGLALGEHSQGAHTVEALGWLAIVAYHSHSAPEPPEHLALARASTHFALIYETLPGASVCIAQALLAIDERDRESVRDLLQHLSRISAHSDYVVQFLLLSAVAAGDDGDQIGKLELLQRAQQELDRGDHSGLLQRALLGARSIGLMQSGAISSARSTIEILRGMPAADPHHVLCAARLVARIALEVGEYQTALTSTDACRGMGDSHAPRPLAYIDVIRAAAHDGLGDASASGASIDRALEWTVRTAWLRPLVSVPIERLRSMLDAAAEREHSEPVTVLIQTLRSQLIGEGPQQRSLSDRERIVLGHLAAGMNRKEISTYLRVSLNTVKSQVRSLYRKLGVSTRHEAVDKAMKHGIIPAAHEIHPL